LYDEPIKVVFSLFFCLRIPMFLHHIVIVHKSYSTVAIAAGVMSNFLHQI